MIVAPAKLLKSTAAGSIREPPRFGAEGPRLLGTWITGNVCQTTQSYVTDRGREPRCTLRFADATQRKKTRNLLGPAHSRAWPDDKREEVSRRGLLDISRLGQLIISATRPYGFDQYSSPGLVLSFVQSSESNIYQGWQFLYYNMQAWKQT